MTKDTRSALLSGRRPPLAVGVLVSIALVGICTGLVYPLKQVTSVASLGVVYLVGVVIVSAGCSDRLGLLGPLARARDLTAERRGVQLLPHTTGRSFHSRRQPQLGPGDPDAGARATQRCQRPLLLIGQGLARRARSRVRDALRRLLQEEQFDRIIVSATESPRIGLSGDDLQWLLQRVPAEVMILRPAPDDTRRIAANGLRGHF